MWDLLLYDKVISGPNIKLLLESTLYRADSKEGKLTTAYVHNDSTELLYRIHAKYFVDATGDSEEKGNYQRVNRHQFSAVNASAIRVRVTATNGDELARIFEVRCYA